MFGELTGKSVAQYLPMVSVQPWTTVSVLLATDGTFQGDTRERSTLDVHHVRSSDSHCSHPGWGWVSVSPVESGWGLMMSQ